MQITTHSEQENGDAVHLSRPQVRSGPAAPSEASRVFHFFADGPDNDNDFLYMGTIFSDGFKSTKRSRVTPTAPSFAAFAWFLARMPRGGELAASDVIEVWHEGKCGRCGRKLTVPESLERGIGPDCAGMLMAVAA